MPYPTQNKKSGICYMLTAMFIFSFLSVIVKDITHFYPVWQVVFFRVFFVLFPSLYMVKRDGGWHLLKTQQLGGLAFLGTLGAFAIYLLFKAFRLLPLADATALAYSSILFITMFSMPILKEYVGIHRWFAVTIGFVGVLIMASPKGDLNTNCLFALTFAFLDAVLMITIRILTRKTLSSVVVFYFALFASMVSGLFMLFEWKVPNYRDLALLIFMGVGSGVAQLFLTNAYRLAPAVVVAPMTYSSMLWGTLFGFIFFDEIPTWQLGIGALLVISAGLYIIYRESLVHTQTKTKRW